MYVSSLSKAMCTAHLFSHFFGNIYHILPAKPNKGFGQNSDLYLYFFVSCLLILVLLNPANDLYQIRYFI